MTNKNCVFCKIVNNQIPSKIIFENDICIAFLDIYPISKGHTIVIPKRHYNNIEDISELDLIDIFKAVKKIAIIIHQKLNVDGYNILQNNYKAAGQEINHFHVHIIPRNKDDERFKLKIPRNQASEEQLNNILALLKS